MSLDALKAAANSAVAPSGDDGASITRAEFDKICDAWNNLSLFSKGEAGNWLRDNHPSLHEAVRYGAASSRRDIGWDRLQNGY